MGKLLSDAHSNVTKLLARLNDKRKNIEQFISDSTSTKELYKLLNMRLRDSSSLMRRGDSIISKANRHTIKDWSTNVIAVYISLV